MNRRLWTALVGLAAVAALVAVPSALAAYTSTKLEIQQSGSTLVAKITADPGDDPTASTRVFAPPGTQVTSTQAPGTVLGNVKVSAKALALGGADLPLAGQLVVAPPGAVTPATQAACTQGATPLATWLMVLQAAGQTVRIPLFLVATSGAATALGPAYVQVCLPPPDIPESQGGAPFGVKLYSATLTIKGVFGPVRAGAWISFWTPYAPGTGQPNPTGTIVAPAAVAPGAVSASAKKNRLGAIVSGKVTQAGIGRGSATVSIFGGVRSSVLRKLGAVTVRANGSFSFRARRGVFFRVSAVATSIAAPPLCTQIAAQLQGVPCVNPTANGFVAQSKTFKKK
jgi:hypothetical protein